jgi:glycosyltransferase involved in cell wall biosynthesis
MSPTPEISVVVPAYNDAAKLERLLASFLELDLPAPTEILVVDDCSTDRTAELMADWCARPLPFRLRHVRQEVNGGPGKARNRGLREARGRLLAYTDSDCVVTPGWLRGLAAAVRPEHHICGAGGPVKALDEGSMAARHYVFHKILEPPASLLYLVTCNCIFLREAVLEVGGFPEGVRLPGGEDVALGILLYKRDWRFARAEDAVVYHDFRHDLGNFYKTWYNYGYGSSYLVHVHLTRDELYPERCNYDAPNWWSGHAIRPTVTGLRTFLKDMRMEIGTARLAGFGPLRIAQAVFTRILERVAYLRGWRVGARRFFDETGTRPFYN